MSYSWQIALLWYNLGMKTKINIRIKELRKELGLSQTDLAREVGASQDAVSLWELGKREPSVSELVKLAKFFNTTLDYLVGLDDLLF